MTETLWHLECSFMDGSYERSSALRLQGTQSPVCPRTREMRGWTGGGTDARLQLRRVPETQHGECDA
jgi:hypothetical protein